jgi:hypothetical protein
MAIPQPLVEQIVALAANGLSRGMIAEQVGHGVTRNAICGLLFRRGIKTSQAPLISKVRRSPRPPLRHAGAPAPRCAPAEIVGVIRPAARLLELADDGCHWPVSWGKGRITLFCNHGKTGSGHPSYCRQHARRAIRITPPFARPHARLPRPHPSSPADQKIPTRNNAAAAAASTVSCSSLTVSLPVGDHSFSRIGGAGYGR